MTKEQFEYYEKDFEKIVQVEEKHRITVERIAKIAELLGMIADRGVLDIYIRVLCDAAIVEL